MLLPFRCLFCLHRVCELLLDAPSLSPIMFRVRYARLDGGVRRIASMLLEMCEHWHEGCGRVSQFSHDTPGYDMLTHYRWLSMHMESTSLSVWCKHAA
jgi:hypothetical protein